MGADEDERDQRRPPGPVGSPVASSDKVNDAIYVTIHLRLDRPVQQLRGLYRHVAACRIRVGDGFQRPFV